MQLSKRLAKILALVTNGCILADIGSDHGYLCVQHILKNNGLKAYACDINPNALNQARKTLSKYPSDKVELRLMNGIESLPSDCEEIVIAGMGYDTIKSILEHKEPLYQNLNKIIIQCNKNIDKLKTFLQQAKIFIQEEHLVYDNAIYYEILVCSSKNTIQTKSLRDDPLYVDYLDHQLQKIQQIPDFEKIPNLLAQYEYYVREKNSTQTFKRN